MALICPRCGHENRDDRNMCSICETSLAPARPVSAGLGPPGARARVQRDAKAAPADPEVGFLGPPRGPDQGPHGPATAGSRPAAGKARHIAVSGGIIGALIGFGGIAFIVACVWLIDRQTGTPDSGWVFLAFLLQAATAGAVGGAIIGALAAHSGGGAATGAKAGAVLAGFVGLLWLISLALRAGSFGPVAVEVWRALVGAGLGAAFGGVIGAAVQAVTDQWN